MDKHLNYEEIRLGDEIPPLVKKPTTVQLFRYSAVTWNSHRIHYDKVYALSEGHAGLLVQGQLHSAFLTQLVTDWIGPRGILKKLSRISRAPAMVGDVLVCRGKISRKYVKDGKRYVECQLSEENQNGAVCSVGKATVMFT